MPKLNRERLIHFIDSSFGIGSTKYHKLGRDLEELSTELNPDTESTKNILGETSVKDNGYEPTTTVEPYYYDTDDEFAEALKDIAFSRKKGDETKTKYLEVIIKDTSDSAHEAYEEVVYVKPTSYGGDTSGFAIPFEISHTGERKKGTATISDGTVTFVAG